jgi:hypothetical protein
MMMESTHPHAEIVPGRAIVKLAPNKPDAELAEEFKKRLVEASAPLMSICDEIKDAGFEAQISWAPGPLGKQVISVLRLVKTF